MNILVLEDRGSVSFYMREMLEEEGHVVLEALSVNDAQSCFDYPDEMGIGQVDCIILDLNMSPDGLTPAEAEQTEDGLLTGWIWLREHVCKRYPSMRKKTIIYSEYLKDLERLVPSEECEGIYMIPKKGSTSTASEVVGRVRAIARVVERNRRETKGKSNR